MSHVIRVYLLACLAYAFSISTANAQRLPIDTTSNNFSGEALLRGVSATKTTCSAIEGAVWAQVDSASAECIRYWKAGFPSNGTVPNALFYIPGDQIVGGLPEQLYATRNPAAMQELAESMQKRLGVPFILLSTPGTFGSSGDHAQRRRPLESRLMSAAIDAIKRKYEISVLTLVGLSGGGHIAASLLSMRSDITCAVLASAVSSPKLRWQSMGRTTDVTGYPDSLEPIDLLHQARFHMELRVFVLGDLLDTNVPWSVQTPIAEALKARGVMVEILNGQGNGAQRHSLGEAGRRVGAACQQDKSNLSIRELEKSGLKG